MSDFADCLNEMRNHYKTNAAEGRSTHYVPSERFAKKFHARNLVGLTADDQQIVEGLQKLGQDTGQEDADYNQQAIAARTEELKGAGNTPEAQKNFKEQMEEQKRGRKTMPRRTSIKYTTKLFALARKILLPKAPLYRRWMFFRIFGTAWSPRSSIS